MIVLFMKLNGERFIPSSGVIGYFLLRKSFIYDCIARIQPVNFLFVKLGKKRIHAVWALHGLTPLGKLK